MSDDITFYSSLVYIEQGYRVVDTDEKKDVKTIAGGMDQRQIYLTIELSGCLIKAINAIIEAIKATKALQFVSGDLYPTLMHDLVSLRSICITFHFSAAFRFLAPAGLVCRYFFRYLCG